MAKRKKIQQQARSHRACAATSHDILQPPGTADCTTASGVRLRLHHVPQRRRFATPRQPLAIVRGCVERPELIGEYGTGNAISVFISNIFNATIF